MLGMILAQAAEAVMSLGLDKMGACLGAAIAVLGAGIGIGKIGAAAMEAIARQPESASDIRSNMKKNAVSRNPANLGAFSPSVFLSTPS